MSTKNYTGLRLDSGDVGTALDMLAGQKQAVRDLCNNKMIQLVAKRATSFVDALIVRHAKENGGFPFEEPSTLARLIDGKDEFYMFSDDGERALGIGEVIDSDHTAMVRAFVEIDDRQRNLRLKPSRDVDVDCDVQMFLHWDPRQKCLLAHFQEEGVGARKQLLTAPGVQDYSFWNSTDDLPKGVTRKAFDQRGTVWDSAYNNPEKLTFTLAWEPDWRPENVKDLFPHLQSAEKRAMKLATTECESKYFQANFKPTSPGSTFGISSLMFKFQDLMQEASSAERKERDKLAVRILAVLPDTKTLQKALETPLNELAADGSLTPSSSRIRP